MADRDLRPPPARRTPRPDVLTGRVVLPAAVLDDGAVVLDGERLAWVGARRDLTAAGYPDAAPDAGPGEGRTILPGLVDLHDHGGGGASFPDATSAHEAQVAAREHLRHGTTSLVASLVTAAPDVLLARTATLADLADDGELAGIHLEGPFLSAVRCGAQNPHDMRDGDPALVRALAAAARGHLRTMTVAPEVPGVVGRGGVIEALADVGAVPSIGHTDATTEQTEAAIEEALAALAAAGRPGARLTATHLFNGMRPLHHREPGPVAACLAAAARGQMVVELVADGAHLAPGTVRSVMELVGPRVAAAAGQVGGADAVALVTDAMAAAGMPDGAYDLGPMHVTVADGVARLTDGGAIAGGTSHLLDVVRATVAAGVALVDAVRAASWTPAEVLGLTDVGGLVAGRRADLVVTDADLRVREVRRAGRPVPAVTTARG
ncbi:N-acetylglucosamine-6-phosphate deacetylase [Cellulosimicrobium sp. CUA-896]|uniref:N-acetylglucosamine-6-phosphate deacetylase n=1 Tax=Cellulosimicrobium sp. CUA-896 TaxID=1517881 RepID=UPI000963517E|nr:amidohydrolase family protein [Cellulosimicrobium sp. CUA-896]OLT45527.1 N-acetylglucosamine-6-phosphate deacetylase [Cellulosimicrobium sp. CUA-896]